MSLVITDVSVLFDLYKLEILPEFFALDMEISTTEFVYNEIVRSEQKEYFEVFERSKKFKILTFTSDEEVAFSEFQLKLSNRSVNDKSIIWKAIQTKSKLLTCDAKIKKEAKYHNIETHGSIWVVTELLNQKIINVVKTVELLELLKQANTRLPYNEIDKIVKKLNTNIDNT